MTIEQYNKATEILREIKRREQDIHRHYREAYGDGNTESVRRKFMGYIRDEEKTIKRLKEQFSKL